MIYWDNEASNVQMDGEKKKFCKKQDHMQGMSTFNLNKSRISMRWLIKIPECWDFIKKLLILLTTHEWMGSLERDFSCLCRKFKSLEIESFVCLILDSIHKEFVELSLEPKEYIHKNRVSQFLYFYTHIWCAHMRWWWWCCIAAMRDAKNKKKETILNLNSPQDWSLAPTISWEACFFS